jgi:histidine triad (HIT) family protein
VAVSECVFCKIVAGRIDAGIVYEDELTTVFLDSGPLFPGHCLVCPKEHYDTLMDVPPGRLEPLFSTAQIVARAIEQGLGAEGSFIAINNKISQSVSHLHVHVIPRRKGDGLKGFFWPRRPYKDKEEMAQVRDSLRTAITSIRESGSGKVHQ